MSVQPGAHMGECLRGVLKLLHNSLLSWMGGDGDVGLTHMVKSQYVYVHIKASSIFLIRQYIIFLNIM